VSEANGIRDVAAKPAPVPDTPPVAAPLWIVPEYMREILDEDPAAAQELVELYFADAAETVQTLTASMLLADARSLCDLSHKLIGGSRQFGVPAIAAVAEAIAAHAMQGDWTAMPSSIARLQSTLLLLSAEVNSKLDA
jgi:HPt (histidine-containing phosphotransfer) domain-containing protein